MFPAIVKEDPNGKDLNAVPNFNMISIQTSLTGKIEGTDAFGAKTSGMIERKFFGTSDVYVNGFRLPHAFVKFNLDSVEILAGKTWHPMFVTQSYPEVLNFNTGFPFQPFSRNPQLRFTYKAGGLNLGLTAYTFRDFPTT